VATSNVRIVARERGKIVAVREGHNTWTLYGRQYLAEQASLLSQGPDVPERDARVKYVGFGIGGKGQNQLSMVQSAPWSTVFAAGLDPNATTGNEYDSDLPVAPPINTLERPVPLTAITGPTPAYSSSLDWRTFRYATALFQQPFSHPDVYTTRYFAQFRQGIGGIYYYIHEPYVAGGFVQMPLSEVGLFLNTATTTVAYEPVVAYITFDTVQVTKDIDIDLEWDIRF
jgi:hypothetical protein